MAASLFTAALCIVVAKTNDIGADVSTPRGYGVTLVMLLMNMVVVAVLTLIWVREMCVNHCYRRVGRGVARVAAARKSLHTSSRRSTHAASGIVVVTPSPSAAVISKRRVGVSAGGGSDGGGAWVGRMLSRRGAGTIPSPAPSRDSGTAPQVADLITNPMRVPRASVRPALSATVVAGGAGVGAVHGSGASGASDSSRNALAFAALHGYFATRGGAGATAKHVPNPAAKAAVARAAREPTPARPRSSGIRRLSDAIGSVLGRAPRLTPSGAPAGGNDSMPPVIWRGSMGVTVAAAPEPGLIPADSSTTPRAPSRRRLSGVMNPLATAAAGARREPRVSIVRSSSSGGMGSPQVSSPSSATPAVSPTGARRPSLVSSPITSPASSRRASVMVSPVGTPRRPSVVLSPAALPRLAVATAAGAPPADAPPLDAPRLPGRRRSSRVAVASRGLLRGRTGSAASLTGADSPPPPAVVSPTCDAASPAAAIVEVVLVPAPAATSVEVVAAPAAVSMEVVPAPAAAPERDPAVVARRRPSISVSVLAALPPSVRAIRAPLLTPPPSPSGGSGTGTGTGAPPSTNAFSTRRLARASVTAAPAPRGVRRSGMGGGGGGGGVP